MFSCNAGIREMLVPGRGIGGRVQTGYGYDALSRLTSLATDVGGSVNTNDDISESFSYTAASQVNSRQLTVTNNNYIYTPTINATTNYTVNGLNQIATTNRPIDDWGQILGDVVLVASLLDRLMHHGHLLKFEGKSWRLKHAVERIAKHHQTN
jgi:hypothetical protein